ncbi:MAG: hypothetical protein ABIK93_07600 [candidate division WOR-3 bacterium]
MKEPAYCYISGLPWNGRFLIREGISDWSPVKISGFYTVSYYNTYGKKIWDIVGILPKDIDLLIEYYALRPSQIVEPSNNSFLSS